MRNGQFLTPFFRLAKTFAVDNIFTIKEAISVEALASNTHKGEVCYNFDVHIYSKIIKKSHQIQRENVYMEVILSFKLSVSEYCGKFGKSI